MPYTVIAEDVRGAVPEPYPVRGMTEAEVLALLVNPPRWVRVLRVTDEVTGGLVVEGFATPSMDLTARPVLIANRVPADWWQLLATCPYWTPRRLTPPINHQC